MPAHLDAVDPATLVAQFARTNRLPGLAAAVAFDGRVAWVGAAGHADLVDGAPADGDTTWHWFSMTKIVTATAAMALVDAGRLDLDAPIDDYLTDLPLPFRGARVRWLLNHSAGFTNPVPIRWVHAAGSPMPDQRVFLDQLLSHQRKPKFTPGTRASYSNVGYQVLGEVIAEASGTSYVEDVTTRVLSRLEMECSGFSYTASLTAHAATGYQRAPRGTAALLRRLVPAEVVGDRVGRYVAFNAFELDGAAYGGLIGSVTDAGRFLAMHTGEGALGGTRILSAASVRAMQVIDTRGDRYDHGLGWFRRRERHRPTTPFVEHLGGGGGFHNLMRLYPERGTGVVIMANTTTSYPASRLSDALAELVHA